MSESEAHRRAEDTPQWRQYLADSAEEDRDPGSVNWATALDTLGAPFAIRILLRRELFQEFKDWLESPALEEAGLSAKDLERMLSDCRITLDSLKNKDAPEEKIAVLRRVIGILDSLAAEP